MVNSGPFVCDTDRTAKDRLTQPATSAPVSQSPCPAACASVRRVKTASPQTADDTLPLSVPSSAHAIEPTATKTDSNHRNMLGKYPEERPGVYCSVPLEKVQEVLAAVGKKEAKGGRKHLCLYCDRAFVTKSLRLRHVERCHSQNRRSSSRRLQEPQVSSACVYCDKMNGGDCELRELFLHLVSAHPNKYFGCVACEDRFPSVSVLNEHNVVAHQDTEEKLTRSKLKRLKNLEPPTRDLRSKKLAVKSSKIGVKRNTRLQTKLPKSKPPETPSKSMQTLANPYPQFDSYFQVKKITDHSIDNLRISTLTFDDVFDKAFYNRIKCNIRENLLNHIDGKLFKNEESETRISNFEKASAQPQEPPTSCVTENYGCELTLNAATPVATLLSTQFGEDLEAQIEYGSKASKKRTQTKTEEVHYKYLTRRKYQASILESKENRDLSKLDMWTQLVIKNRQQKIANDKKTPKELLDYTKCQEYKTKLQQEELNRILDKRGPFEDLKEEATKKAALDKLNLSESSQENFSIVADILAQIIGKICAETCTPQAAERSPTLTTPETTPDSHVTSYLKLRRGPSTRTDDDEIDKSDKITLICSSQETENFDAPNAITRQKNELVELTGEWARARIYVCAACGLKLPNMKFLMDHKGMFHQNVWCQHYEFVGNQSELYRHLSIPVLGKVGVIERDAAVKFWQRSDARLCSKCSKQCHTLGELHRHVLECGEDWTWMLVRKKCKYRPYGAKTRRKRRGLIKRTINLDQKPREKRKYRKRFEGPKSKPSDVETIQRMLANLPAKRATRKIMSLKDGFPRASKPKQNKTAMKSTLQSKQLKSKKRPRKGKIRQNKARSNLTRRRSLRKLNKVLSSHILDTNSTLVMKRKMKSAISGLEVKAPVDVKPKKVVKSVSNAPSEEKKPPVSKGKKRKAPERSEPVNGIKKYFPVRKTRQIVQKAASSCDNKVEISANVANCSDELAQVCENSSILRKPKLNIMGNFVRTLSIRSTKSEKSEKQVKLCDNAAKPKPKPTVKRKLQTTLKNAVKTIKHVGQKNLIHRTRKRPKLKTETPPADDEMPELEKVPDTPEKREQPAELPVLSPVVLNFESQTCVDAKFTKEGPTFDFKPQLKTELEDKPTVEKKLKKPTRGLNDCIAMLTNKLQQQKQVVIENLVENQPSEIVDPIEEKIEPVEDDQQEPQTEVCVPTHVVEEMANDGSFKDCLLELEKHDIDVMNGMNYTVPRNRNNKKIAPQQRPVKRKKRKSSNITVVDDLCMPREELINDLLNNAILNLYSDEYLIKNSFEGSFDSEPGVLETKSLESSDSEDDLPLVVFKKSLNASEENTSTLEPELDLKTDDVVETDDYPNPEEDMQICTSPLIFDSFESNNLIVTQQVESVSTEESTPGNQSVNDSSEQETVEQNLYTPAKRTIKTRSSSLLEKDSDLSSKKTSVSEHNECDNENPKVRKNSLPENENSSSMMRITRARKISLEQEELAKESDESHAKGSDDAIAIEPVEALEDAENENKGAKQQTSDVFKTPLKSQDDNSFITTPDLEDGAISRQVKANFRLKLKSKRGRKPKTTGNADVKEFVCTICEKSFLRNDTLTKHKRTLTHIAKLSELEAQEASNKAKLTSSLEISDESSKTAINLSSILQDSDKYNKISNDLPIVTSNFSLHGPANSTLKLADIINEVLNKPVDGSPTQLPNFSDLILQSPTETNVKRCKSLGERKSFESDIQSPPSVNDYAVESFVDVKNDIYHKSNCTDSILEKQISLLENIIENRTSLNYIDDISISSDDSDNKRSKPTSNEYVQPNFVKPTQYEEISDDSANYHGHYDDQKSRKALNRDEELFLECCSLLKSGSEISNYSKKSNRMTRALKNFQLKSGTTDYNWLEHKNFSLRCQLNETSNFMSDTSRIPTPLGDNFADDGCNSNTMTFNWQDNRSGCEKNAPIFEDISDEDNKVVEKSELVTTFKDVHFPKSRHDFVEFGDSEESTSFGEIVADALKNKFEQTKREEEMSEKEVDNKKPLTKGAMKVFEGLKVSIPTEELNIEELLQRKMTSKEPELIISVDDEKLPENESIQEVKTIKFVATTSKSKLKSKLKTLSKKIKPKNLKKSITKRFVSTKVDENDDLKSKSVDVYDFEETQDNSEVFEKNPLSLYRSFKTQTNETDAEKSIKPRDSFSFEAVSNISNNSAKRNEPKTQKPLTKKKGLIVGRIFKNAFKSKPDVDDNIREIPTVDNNILVNDYIQNGSEQNEPVKPQMSEKEMDIIFNKLLNEENRFIPPRPPPNPDPAKNLPKTLQEPPKQPLKPTKPPKIRKRQRHNSESTDDEFSIGKPPKKRTNKKNPKETDNSINLEQELKECIGVASRKSQRKCTSGKQNILVEFWSSDESDSEPVLESKPIQIEEPIVNTPVIVEPAKRVRNVLKTSETAAVSRRKRASANTLYYWSSSSDDEYQDLIELKPIRDELEDEECPMQHGWIVGDSPKKLVTMLAQAKGNKRLDADSVKEQARNRIACS